jgi:SAM-dependent methyltransferase
MAHNEGKTPALDAIAAETRARWEARYRTGFTPWDTQITPPEVLDFWQSGTLSPQGIALDLGCGPGTNVRYLAALGLTAIGIEIANAPLELARQRLHHLDATLTQRTHFVLGDVTLLPFQRLNAAYILDIGCLHSLPRPVRPGYVQGVIANLSPGGYYHLYAFDADADNPNPESGPPGMSLDEVVQSFTSGLTLVHETVARPERRPCRWYLLQRPLQQL